MTTGTLDYSITARRTKVPLTVVALLLGTAVVLAAQLWFSYVNRYASPIWAAWPRAVLVLHVASMLGVIGLSIWAMAALMLPDLKPAPAVAAFGRYTVLIGLFVIVATFTFEARVTDRDWLRWIVRLARAGVTLGLPVYLLAYLGRSPRSHAVYGKNFGSTVGDFVLASVTRDGAVSILLMLAALVSILFTAAIPSIKQFGAGFLIEKEWRANELPGQPIKDERGKVVIEDGEILRSPPIPATFGALPMIYGTFVSSAIALLVAVPLSFGAALFLIRISPDLKPSMVKGAVAGLLLTMMMPKFVNVLLSRGGIQVGVFGWLGSLVLGLVVAELLVWMVGRSIDGLKVGQAVPPAYDVALHALIAVLGVAFVRSYLGMGWGGGLLTGVIGSGIMFLIAPYFTTTISFLIEFLAAIPSIAYGLWGMHVLAVFLQSQGEPAVLRILSVFGLGSGDVPTGRDMLCGGLILGIMIIPIITAISRDVLRAVPDAQVEGTTALGATWWESSIEMLKYSRSALFGAVMLGLARAAGETMAVTMVIGNNPQINGSVFKPAQTMASLLANEFGEASPGDLHYSALMYVAFILLTMSLIFNVVARYFVVGKGARTAAAH